MLSFTNFTFEYLPYPVAVAQPILDPSLYAALVADFPQIEEFSVFNEAYGKKWRLNETADLARYRAVLKKSAAYNSLYRYFKSDAFIRDTLHCFESNNIKLRLFEAQQSSSSRPVQLGRLGAWMDTVERKLRGRSLATRFEFSALPAHGGSIAPHTDAPNKIITLVISIAQEGEWDPAWGGGTDVLVPNDPRESYNFYNKYLAFDACTTIRTVPYVPNQCMLFLKTYNSLHCVKPTTGPENGPVRKTLTVNIEWV
jgi:hypothetical protein